MWTCGKLWEGVPFETAEALLVSEKMGKRVRPRSTAKATERDGSGVFHNRKTVSLEPNA